MTQDNDDTLFGQSSGPINTQGWGTYVRSWVPDSYGWWAWTSQGYMFGEASTEAEAGVAARQAVTACALVPKGDG